MLLHVDKDDKSARRVTGTQLREFGLKEVDFQSVLYKSLDRLVGEEELLLLMRSRAWQEEPDLMALDRKGNLYIFEIKVWESHSENLLQVLRYGQINGILDYDGLNKIWSRDAHQFENLADAHVAKFGTHLPREHYNQSQIFIVLTNGLDTKTRQAIKYWRSTKLDVRPWIYRSYKINEELYLEILPFRTQDDPLEDMSEGAGSSFYVFNTNFGNDEADDADMLANNRVAAFYSPWKFKVERLRRGDFVFLYRSGYGIVAIGKASGVLQILDHDGEPEEEFRMSLDHFRLVQPHISAAEMKIITQNSGLTFRQTMFSIDPAGGITLWNSIINRG